MARLDTVVDESNCKDAVRKRITRRKKIEKGQKTSKTRKKYVIETLMCS